MVRACAYADMTGSCPRAPKFEVHDTHLAHPAQVKYNPLILSARGHPIAMLEQQVTRKLICPDTFTGLRNYKWECHPARIATGNRLVTASKFVLAPTTAFTIARPVCTDLGTARFVLFLLARAIGVATTSLAPTDAC